MPKCPTDATGDGRKTLLIVDDHPVLRRGPTALIESEPGLVVNGSVGSRTAAFAAIEASRPDLVIVDLMLDRDDGLDL
ncbi:MAG: response regulator, partial [Bradyrhizobium sp.]|uniref:response regulator transcription factor n=1 Tax=Bradyrhizobium sp. TaxID=376 RepID=UPI0029038C9E